MGSVFNLFSFGLLAVKAALTKRMSNVSLKTLQCYAVLLAARLTSILKYEGYLPYDKRCVRCCASLQLAGAACVASHGSTRALSPTAHPAVATSCTRRARC